MTPKSLPPPPANVVPLVDRDEEEEEPKLVLFNPSYCGQGTPKYPMFGHNVREIISECIPEEQPGYVPNEQSEAITVSQPEAVVRKRGIRIRNRHPFKLPNPYEAIANVKAFNPKTYKWWVPQK